MHFLSKVLIAVAALATFSFASSDLFQAPPVTDIEKFRLLANGNMTHVCMFGAWVTQDLNAVLYLQDDNTYAMPIGTTFITPEADAGGGRFGFLINADNSTATIRTITFRQPKDSNSIDEILGITTTSSTYGALEKITYIARLNANGGAAPNTTCTDAEILIVPFTVEYAFYGLE